MMGRYPPSTDLLLNYSIALHALRGQPFGMERFGGPFGSGPSLVKPVRLIQPLLLFFIGQSLASPKEGSTVMENASLSVGDPIEGRCTKCRKNTDHVIVTLAEDGPGKVQCTVCSREHKYRPPTAARKSAARRTIDPKEAERQEWQALQPTMDSAKATAYSMDAAYKVNALISHPKFGLGVVQRVVGPQKMEVLFEDGLKMMRCQ